MNLRNNAKVLTNDVYQIIKDNVWSKLLVNTEFIRKEYFQNVKMLLPGLLSWNNSKFLQFNTWF